jgi:hypothetical protein
MVLPSTGSAMSVAVERGDGVGVGLEAVDRRRRPPAADIEPRAPHRRPPRDRPRPGRRRSAPGPRSPAGCRRSRPPTGASSPASAACRSAASRPAPRRTPPGWSRPGPPASPGPRPRARSSRTSRLALALTAGEAVRGSVGIVDGDPVRLHVGPDREVMPLQRGLVQALDPLQGPCRRDPSTPPRGAKRPHPSLGQSRSLSQSTSCADAWCSEG